LLFILFFIFLFPFFYLTYFLFIWALASKKDNNRKHRGSEDPSEEKEETAEASEDEVEKKPQANKLTKDTGKYCVCFIRLIYQSPPPLFPFFSLFSFHFT
jgi:hypothetical protein